jgi:predicted transcriptional regulator
MSPRRRVSFFLDDDLEAGLEALKRKVGIPKAEAIRRAIAEYLERQGVGTDSKPERKRAATRKRP